MQPINRPPQARPPQQRRPDPSNPYVPQDRPAARPAEPVPERPVPPQRPQAPRPQMTARPQGGHSMRPMTQPRAQAPKQHLNYETNIQPLGQINQQSVGQLFGQQAPKSPPRRDPAPSRTRYKLQRLWLTPMVRRLLKASIPAVGLIGIMVYLGTNQQLRDDWSNRLTETRKSIETRPEFMVNLMKISGVDAGIQDQVRQISGIALPLTSFDLDLPIIRKRIEALDTVKSASLHLRTGGVLDIVVTERKPTVLWRSLDGIEMLDADGVRAGTVKSRLDRPNLPLIAGTNANEHIDEAMRILATAEPLKDRVRGLLWVGDRRWDLVLNRDQTIQLPSENPIAAVERLVAWQASQAVLSRDVTTVDLRNPSRPYIRLTPNALDQLRGARGSIKVKDTKL